MTLQITKKCFERVISINSEAESFEIRLSLESVTGIFYWDLIKVKYIRKKNAEKNVFRGEIKKFL
jgi:hypothetical protein